MYWHSVADFLAMGQHGLYVWGSVLVTAILMIGEPLLIVRRRKTVITRLQRQFHAEQADGRRMARSGESNLPRNAH
ncbi:MAG TPA: heme exporter protein CcmD [Accumulibacter sp.]|jgi:heme exporter protein D|nr:heme exporter protein CcmD [Accumulibacter sp.]HPP46418.1 heme exporter protein CcmD [Accumulibacter sp.]